MRDGSRCKIYKTPRGGHSAARSPALVQGSTQSLTQAPAPTITHSQIGVTTYLPVLQTEVLQQTSAQSQAQSQAQAPTHNLESHAHIQSHPQSLIHTESLVLTEGDGHSCPQSQVMVQVMPRTLTQELVYSHPQVLLQTHVNTQSEVHTPSQIQSHVHTHTNSQVLSQVQVHTHTQDSTQIPDLSPVCTHVHANNQPPLPPPPPPPPHSPQAQRYAHSQSQPLTQLSTPQLLTQSQIHSQPQTHTQTHIHIQPQVHTHTQVHTQNHTHMQPHMHSDSQPQTHPISSVDTHIHVQSQLQPLSIQAQLPALSEASLSSTLPELVDTTQTVKSPQKNSEGLEVVHIPISRQHSSPAVSLQDLHTSPVTMNDVLGSSSHTQLMHTLTAFPLTDQLNSSITLQQNSATLSQALTQTPTQSQILDSLSVERVLMPSRSSLGHTVIAQEPSVEISGLPAIQGQENFTSCSEQPSSSVKESEVSKSIDSSQLSSSQINSQQLGEPQLSSLHLLPGGSVGAHPLPGKTPTVTTTTSTLIASNRMLNKLLDSAKPHIPSQVTKAAEIAQLVPNLTARLPPNSSTHSGELINGAEMAFTSRCGSSSHTTFTRNSLASMCTVTSSMRGSGGEMGCKASPTLSADNIYSLSSSFPAHSPTLVQPSPTSQRQVDVLQQVMLTSQSTSGIGEQLEGLSSEGLRLLPPTPNVTRASPVASCSASTVSSLASVLPSDKTIRKVGSSNCQSCIVPKSFGISGLSEGLNNGASLLESSARFQSSSCSKTGLITSTDPMFTSVAVTSGCSSPPSLGTVIPVRLGNTAHEGLERLKATSSDTRTSHQTFVDLLSRGSASDGVVDSNCGTSTSLTGLSDSRPPHTSDVLLSELHRSDENDLSLGATLSATTGEDLHNASNLATEASLVAGMGGDSAPMQELPSPPLSSFSLPNITGDFMVNEVSGSKNCHPSQTQLPALLSNLPTADLDRFLDNSNTCMCIDISLSDSEVSLSAESSFTYSPGKSHTHRKSLSTTATELTFTSALKDATTKSSSEEIKPHSDSETSSNFLNHEHPLLQEPAKFLSARSNSLSVAMDISSDQVDFHPAKEKAEAPAANIPRTCAQIQMKSSQSQKGKRKEIFKRNELLVQQVACFKCRLCSFLSQDKSEMVNHMKEHHSQYYSDTEESEEDVGQRTPKKIKVLLPQGEGKQSGSPSRSYEPKKSIRANRQGSQKKQKPDQESSNKGKSHMVKAENKEVEGKVGVHIKSEPRDIGEFEGSLIGEDDNEVEEEEEEENGEEEEEEEEDEEEEEEENTGLTIKTGEREIKNGASEQEYVDEDDTNDSSATSDSTTVTTRASSTQSSQPPPSRSSGATKRKNAKKSSDDNASIRCDVNGCGLRMKSESNIIYHRKCHVNSMLQCQECLSTKFQSWRDLALHLWRHHLIDMELHKCDKCDYKSYSYSKLMNVHHKIHSDERPSLCDICGKRFKTPKQLRNHKTLHMKKTEAPQHQCEICHRPFSDKRMLRNHQESVHKKVKPFLCNYCGYSTASRSTLKMHMRQHTGEKPFACEKCKYRTSDHNSLRRHKMQHSGVRPYRCPYCDYASIQSTTFKVHLKDKHPGLAQIDGIMFTCGVCSFKTVKRDNFLAHVAEHSRGDGKKQRQPTSPTPASKIEEPQGIYGDLTPSAPHVVNIDVNSGTVTVESPQDTDFLSSVRVQAPVPGQVIMAGDKYVYATVDSSVLSQVRSGERIVQLTQDVVGVPLSLPLETSTCSPLQSLVYVATTTSQGGQ